ncbi:MAG: hypothetical protein U0840_22075 [Gemmataceae bacterium]
MQRWIGLTAALAGLMMSAPLNAADGKQQMVRASAGLVPKGRPVRGAVGLARPAGRVAVGAARGAGRVAVAAGRVVRPGRRAARLGRASVRGIGRAARGVGRAVVGKPFRFFRKKVIVPIRP